MQHIRQICLWYSAAHSGSSWSTPDQKDQKKRSYHQGSILWELRACHAFLSELYFTLTSRLGMHLYHTTARLPSGSVAGH